MKRRSYKGTACGPEIVGDDVMIRKDKVVLFGRFLLVLLASLLFNQSDSWAQTSQSTIKPPPPVGSGFCEGVSLQFQVLRSWAIPKDKVGAWANKNGGTGVGIEILVPEGSSKSAVVELSNCISSKYKSQGFVYFQIYDLKEAYINRNNDNYPEVKLLKHYLLEYTHNPANGYDSYTWIPDMYSE